MDQARPRPPAVTEFPGEVTGEDLSADRGQLLLGECYVSTGSTSDIRALLMVEASLPTGL